MFCFAESLRQTNRRHGKLAMIQGRQDRAYHGGAKRGRRGRGAHCSGAASYDDVEGSIPELWLALA